MTVVEASEMRIAWTLRRCFAQTIPAQAIAAV
jgi:hypothetical protein